MRNIVCCPDCGEPPHHEMIVFYRHNADTFVYCSCGCEYSIPPDVAEQVRVKEKYPSRHIA